MKKTPKKTLKNTPKNTPKKTPLKTPLKETSPKKSENQGLILTDDSEYNLNQAKVIMKITKYFRTCVK